MDDGLQYTDGLTLLWPSVWTALAMVLSVWLLTTALKTIPIGIGYAVRMDGHRRCRHSGGREESRAVIGIASIIVIMTGIVGLETVHEMRTVWQTGKERLRDRPARGVDDDRLVSPSARLRWSYPASWGGFVTVLCPDV
jgi:quaternary ammonium compound-resistance protein SugE